MVLASIKKLLRSNRARVGLLLSTTPLWKLAYQALDAWGNLQTMKDVLPYLWAFVGSWWGAIALMLVGFALLSWQIRKQSHAATTTESDEASKSISEQNHHESQSSSAVSSLAQSSPQESPKRIVEISLEELSGLYDVHPKEEAEKLLAGYLGAWIFASGVTVKTYMYGPRDDEETTVVLQTGNVHVNARFPNYRQASRIHLAHSETGGVRVKVFGRIDEIEHGLVNLADCEIVELKLPSPS